jgi:hypothetical protein
VARSPAAWLTPSRQTAVSVGKNKHFSRGLDPLRQLFWLAEGARGEKKLDSRVLLALRQFARLPFSRQGQQFLTP